jgi:hypothetical protein
MCAGFTPGTGFIWVNLTPNALTNPPVGSLYFDGVDVIGLPLTDNLQLLGTDGAGSPSQVSINGGAGISVDQSGGLITISNTAMGAVEAWIATSVNTTMQTTFGYIVSTAATMTLPATSALGGTVVINAISAGLIVQCGVTQQIRGVGITTGAGERLISLTAGSSITLESQDATGTLWGILAVSGNWDVVGGPQTTMNSLGAVTSGGILYFPSVSGPLSTVPAPNLPNSSLVSNTSGQPVFAAPPTYITIDNSRIQSTGTVYPLSGSAPTTATANLTSPTIAYTASAYTGYASSIYSPKDPSLSTLRVSGSIPVYARSTATSTGGQTLGTAILAIYDSQTALFPIKTFPAGTAGVFEWADTVNIDFDIASIAYVSGFTMYFCIFFDNLWATSGMQGCIGGIVNSSNITASSPKGTITIRIEEEVVAATYNP